MDVGHQIFKKALENYEFKIFSCLRSEIDVVYVQPCLCRCLGDKLCYLLSLQYCSKGRFTVNLLHLKGKKSCSVENLFRL
jgi:hypothetical protein